MPVFKKKSENEENVYKYMTIPQQIIEHEKVEKIHQDSFNHINLSCHFIQQMKIIMTIELVS